MNIVLKSLVAGLMLPLLVGCTTTVDHEQFYDHSTITILNDDGDIASNITGHCGVHDNSDTISKQVVVTCQINATQSIKHVFSHNDGVLYVETTNNQNDYTKGMVMNFNNNTNVQYSKLMIHTEINY